LIPEFLKGQQIIPATVFNDETASGPMFAGHPK